MARLKDLLRGRLQPLYRVYLPSALEYAVSVLKFIHNQRIILALEEPYKSKYKSDLLAKPIQPGMKGNDFSVFEVPADSANFILKIWL